MKKLDIFDGVVIGFMMGFTGAIIIILSIKVYLPNNIYLGLIFALIGYIFCWLIVFFVGSKLRKKVKEEEKYAV